MSLMSKSPEITTNAIVIGRAQAGDGSVRVFLYTEHGGLLSALAKSGREERSKLRPHLQVGSFGSYSFVKGTQGWRVVGAVDTQNAYFDLHHSALAQRSVDQVLGIVRQLVRGEERNEELFESLWNFLHATKTLDEELLKTAEHVAVLRMVAALGYASLDANEVYSASTGYDLSVLESAKNQNRKIVRTINDALAISGLS